MRSRRGLLWWSSPFLVGVAAATALEVSAGLLLYTDGGFLPALTLILTVDTLAFAMGVWLGTGSKEGSVVEDLRWRWLFALVCFSGAALYSVGREFLAGYAGTALSQGLGLALLGSLPLFALGSLLGAMSGMGSGPDGPPRSVGFPALAGAAAGFLLTGAVLAPGVEPVSAYLLCIVLLSGGALLQGRALDRGPLREERAVVRTPFGTLTVEDRRTPETGKESRVLLEHGRVRGAETPEGEPDRGWERAVLAAVRGGALDQGGTMGAVLYVGGGSGTLARHLEEAAPGARVRILERDPALWKAASEHLRSREGREHVEVDFGDPRALLLSSPEAFHLVLVDAGIFPWLGPVPFLREEDWRALRGATREDGALVLAGLPDVGADTGEAVLRLLAEGGKHFSDVALYRSEPMESHRDDPDHGPDHEGGSRGGEGEDGAFLLFRTEGAAPWSPALPPFRVQERGG